MNHSNNLHVYYIHYNMEKNQWFNRIPNKCFKQIQLGRLNKCIK